MDTQYTSSSLYVAGTIVIGLGGSGAETVRLIKARVRQSMSPPPGIIEFLTADTEPRQNEPGREHLSQGEYAYLGDYNARRVLEELDSHPHIKDWWFEKDQIVTGTIHKGARQRRPVGRLSLYVNWNEFARSFDNKAKTIREIVEREKTQVRGINVQRTGLVKVYIISSVCGGTGSAIFLDVAFRARQILGDDADIMGIFYLPSCFLPEIQSVKQQQRIKANAYASLLELNHFLKGNPFEASFPDEPFKDRLGNKVTTTLSRPYDTVYLLDRSNNKEEMSSLENIRYEVAQQVFLDILTPMSARFAARRANLQDLAGEKSDAGSGGQSQVLAIAGFSTASLILPSAQMREVATSLYGASVIRERIIGQPHSQVDYALDERLRTRLDDLSQKLQFERQISGGTTTPNNGNDEWDDDDWDDDGDLGDDGQGIDGGNRQIDLREAAKVIDITYHELCRDLRSDFKSHHLRGMAYILEELISGVGKLLADTRQHVQQARATIDANTQRLSEEFKGPSFIQGRKARIRAEQAYNARRANWDAENARLERERQRDQLKAQTLTRLSEDLEKIKASITGKEGHIERLEALAQELEVRAEANTIGKLPQRLTRQRQRADVFELATYVGGEHYTTVIDGVTSNEPYWSWAPRRAVHDAQPGAEALEEFDTAVGEYVFGLRVDSSFGPDRNLRLPAFDAANQNAIIIAAQTLYQDGVTTDFSIMEYLRWFYKYVRHGSNEARFSPLDPLQMLNDRCKSPFLEIDKARLGTEGGNDTEPVRLLGIPEMRSPDPLAQDVLDDFDSNKWEDVSTGIYDRIDISYSRHGYPLKVLKDLDVFKKSYRHFLEEGDKLHPHRDWPNGMDDLLGE